jgi:hypothetical protein
MPFPCHAMALRVQIVSFPFDLHSAAVFDSHIPCRARAMPRCSVSDYSKTTAQRGIGMAWHLKISIGRPQTACGRPARVRPLPATTRSSTKVVIRSMQIRYTLGLAVGIFPATTRTLTEDTALSENGRGVAWHV